MKVLRAKNKVEVIRRGLVLLKETTDRKALRAAFKNASEKTRETLSHEMEELDPLISDGLD